MADDSELTGEPVYDPYAAYAGPPAPPGTPAPPRPLGTPGSLGPGPSAQAPAGKRDRFALWLVAAVVGVLLLAGGVLLLVTRDSGEGARVSLPESFAGYQLLHNTAADDLRRKLQGQVPLRALGDAIFGHASVGAYAHNTGDQPALIVLALPRRSIAALGSGDDESTVNQLLDASVPASVAIPSGQYGGVLRCGPIDKDGETLSACAWSDARTAGVAVVGYPPLDAAETAALVNRLRDLIG